MVAFAFYSSLFNFFATTASHKFHIRAERRIPRANQPANIKISYRWQNICKQRHYCVLFLPKTDLR